LVQLDQTEDEGILDDTEDHSRTNENLPDALSPAEKVLFAHEVGELASQNSHFESGLNKFGTPRFNLGKKEDFFDVAFVPFVNNANETKAVLVGQYLGTSQQRIGIIKRDELVTSDPSDNEKMNLLVFASFDKLLYDNTELSDIVEKNKKGQSNARGCSCVCFSTCSRASAGRSCSSTSCWSCDEVCRYEGPTSDTGGGGDCQECGGDGGPGGPTGGGSGSTNSGTTSGGEHYYISNDGILHFDQLKKLTIGVDSEDKISQHIIDVVRQAHILFCDKGTYHPIDWSDYLGGHNDYFDKSFTTCGYAVLWQVSSGAGTIMDTDPVGKDVGGKWSLNWFSSSSPTTPMLVISSPYGSCTNSLIEQVNYDCNDNK